MSQVRAWDIAHLTQAATDWTRAAIVWEDAFAFVSSHVANPGGMSWEGAAAEVVQQRGYSDRLKVAAVADRLHAAAGTARRGADRVDHVKQETLAAVKAAVDAGFFVGDDVSVRNNDRHRQSEAQLIAAGIRSRVEALIAADREIAAQITRATNGIGDLLLDNAAQRSDDGDAVRLVDFRQSPVAESPSPEAPGGGYGSYHYGYEFSTAEGWTKEQIMNEIQQHFNNYFTFTADKGELINGATVNLRGPFGENEPVRVSGITPDSFSFVSLPGHNEGAGRTITFNIVPSSENPIPGRLNWELRVAASGPLSKGSLVPGASWLNKGIWQVFADNLNAKLPTLSPQPGLATV